MTSTMSPVDVMPRVNIYETENDVSIEAEMPGVSKDTVNIEINDRELVLTGKRAANGDNAKLRFRERSQADYRRSFALGKAVDPSKVDAEMHDGLLRITLHKADRAKTRRVEIN